MKMTTVVVMALAVATGALVWSFSPRTLPLSGPETLSLAHAQPPAGMRIGVIKTGAMQSQAIMGYRGGSLEPRTFGMDVVVVQHPKGTLLFDAGFGREVMDHYQTVPWLMRAVSKISVDPAGVAVEQLPALGLAPEQLMGVVLTHAHWDHVSGLADLPGVPVWVNESERAFIDNGGMATALARKLGDLNYSVYRFDSGPYWGYPQSRDVFGDGSVVLVPGGGHTPGSTIAFVHTPDGKSYALIGDLAWQREGIDLPAERPWISRVLVDDDWEQVRAALVRLHLLRKALPELVIVPAHDRRVMETLPSAQAWATQAQETQGQVLE